MKLQYFCLGSCILLGSGLLTCSAPVAAATVENATKAEIKSATESYERGVEAMDADKYAEALAQFQKSYETVESPNSRMMVGRALVKLARLTEAHRELSRAIAEATNTPANQKKYKKTVETAQKELDDIKAKLAFLTVRHGAKLQLQGQVMAAADWNEPQPVMPGSLLVEVTFADGRQVQKLITLKAGERSEFLVEPPQAAVTGTAQTPASTAPVTIHKSASGSGLSRSTLGYLLGGVGIVGLGTFVGFGLVAASSYGSPQSSCVGQVCPQGALDDQASKSMFEGIGYAGLGIGVVGLGLGTWLILSGDPKTRPSTSLHLGPSTVQLTRRF